MTRPAVWPRLPTAAGQRGWGRRIGRPYREGSIRFPTARATGAWACGRSGSTARVPAGRIRRRDGGWSTGRPTPSRSWTPCTSARSGCWLSPQLCPTHSRRPTRCPAGSAGSPRRAPPRHPTSRGPGCRCPLRSGSLLLRPGRISTAASLPLMGPAPLWPPLMASHLRRRLRPPDRALLDLPQVRRTLDETFAQELRQGRLAGAYDRAATPAVGAPVADVPRPVRLQHGRADWQAPLPGARLLAAVMPTADLRGAAGHRPPPGPNPRIQDPDRPHRAGNAQAPGSATDRGPRPS